MPAKKEETQETTTEIAIKSASSVVSNVDILNKFQKKASVLQDAANTGITYIKFTKLGEWVHGEDESEIKEDEKWVVNPMSYLYGCVGFEAGEFKGEHLVSMIEDAPMPTPEDCNAKLPINKVKEGDGWRVQHGVRVASLTGTQGMYKASSKGGIGCLSQLIGLVGERTINSPESCFPVIMFNNTTYKHKEFGKIFTPILKIVGWAMNDSKEIVESYE